MDTTASSLPEGPNDTPGTARTSDATSYAVVERYLPNGTLDPRFGSDGAVITDFGFPLPARPPQIPDYAEVLLPVDVNATGIAVDSRERVVITGTHAYTYYGVGKAGSAALLPAPEAFVARLTTRGTQDIAFNETGTSTMPGVISIGRPALDPDGSVFFIATQDEAEFEEQPLAQVIGHLDNRWHSRSQLRQRWLAFVADRHAVWLGIQFESDPRPAGTTPPVRTSASGQASAHRRTPRRSEHRALQGKRLAAIATFGHDGVTTIASQAGQVGLFGLAVTNAGRILATGSIRSESRSGKGERTWRLLLARLTRDGSLGRHFGEGGVVTTSFGAKAASEGQAVLVGANGRAVVGGTASYGPRPPAHFVLARYLLGR